MYYSIPIYLCLQEKNHLFCVIQRFFIKLDKYYFYVAHLLPLMLCNRIMDCKAAVRFLRANAEKYGIDPDRIASAGTSAGAHLALLLAVTGDVKELEGDIGGYLEESSRIQACVDFYGMTDILNLSTDLYNAPYNISGIDAYNQVDAFDSARSQLIGFNKEGQGIGVLRAEEYNPDTPYKKYLDLVKLASPIYFVTTDDPPIYMANGGKDHRVSVAQPERLNIH